MSVSLSLCRCKLVSVSVPLPISFGEMFLIISSSSSPPPPCSFRSFPRKIVGAENGRERRSGNFHSLRHFGD